MTKRNRFQRGSGCFACKNCGKQTRDTGDNGDCQLCPLCYYKAGCGNSLSDAGFNGNGKADAWTMFDACKSQRECDDLLTSELAKLSNQQATA